MTGEIVDATDVSGIMKNSGLDKLYLAILTGALPRLSAGESVSADEIISWAQANPSTISPECQQLTLLMHLSDMLAKQSEQDGSAGMAIMFKNLSNSAFVGLGVLQLREARES